MTGPDLRVAIVTGAASGIGAAAAEKLLDSGWAVAAVDLDEAAVESRHGPSKNSLALGADISKPDAVDALYARTAETFGRLDAVVNAAGISDRRDTVLEEVPVEVFARTIEVNLHGTFLMCRAAIAPLRAAGGGAIVNLGSTASVRGTGGPSYISSKHAIAGLTRAIAVQYAKDLIRCTTVAPGPTNTPMLALAKTKKSSTSMNLVGTIPGEAEPSEIAGLIEFLISDTGRLMTGSIYTMDAGITQY